MRGKFLKKRKISLLIDLDTIGVGGEVARNHRDESGIAERGIADSVTHRDPINYQGHGRIPEMVRKEGGVRLFQEVDMVERDVARGSPDERTVCCRFQIEVEMEILEWSLYMNSH